MWITAQDLRLWDFKRRLDRSAEEATCCGARISRARPEGEGEQRDHDGSHGQAGRPSSARVRSGTIPHPVKRGARLRSVSGSSAMKFVEPTTRVISDFDLGGSNARAAGFRPNR
jgi:hypothetical protein